MSFINIRDSLRRMADDEELFHDVLATYLEDMPKRIAELEEAVGRGLQEEAARVAHTIKGASDNAGAETMRDLARELMLLYRSGSLRAGMELLGRLSDAWTGTAAEIEGILGA